jgi:TPR repeat protein
MFALGALHGGGHDLPTDRAVAIKWFRAAAELGHPTAALMLGRYLRKGLVGPVNALEAQHWLNRALELGVEEAKIDLNELAPLLPAEIQPADNALPYRAASD